MQIGGGITAINADDYIRAGATHVIVTSFVFKDGRVNYGNLKSLVKAVERTYCFGFKLSKERRTILYSYRQMAEVY